MPEITQDQIQCVEEIFQRIVGDLAMIADRDFVVDSISAESAVRRPAGLGKIHISFRLGFREEGREHHGCLLVPLPDAITLACCLMMLPEEAVQSSRELTTLDVTTKDAMLEVGNFITGATDAALQALGYDHLEIVFEGCQGVKPDVRPALDYSEGDELVLGTAQARLASFPADTMILLLPASAFPAAA